MLILLLLLQTIRTTFTKNTKNITKQSSSDSLEFYARASGSNKARQGNGGNEYHGYTRYYERIFNRIRYDPVRLVEIGVEHGRSMKMWQQYFTNAEHVYGIGFRNFQTTPSQKCSFDSETRVETSTACTIYKGDQSSVSFLKHFAKETGGNFDIIIDDGSRVPSHQLVSFETLWPHVRAGGMYIVEDIETNWWKSSASMYGYSLKKNPNVVEKWKGLVETVNREFTNGHSQLTDENLEIYGNIVSVEFGQNIIIIHKALKREEGMLSRKYRYQHLTFQLHSLFQLNNISSTTNNTLTVHSNEEPSYVIVRFLRDHCHKYLMESNKMQLQLCNQATIEHIYNWFCSNRTCRLPIPQTVALELTTSINVQLFAEPWEHPLRKVEEFAQMCVRMGVVIGRKKLVELVHAFCSKLYCDEWDPNTDLTVPQSPPPTMLTYAMQWSELDMETFLDTSTPMSLLLPLPSSVTSLSSSAPFHWVSASFYINLRRRIDRKIQFQTEMKNMNVNMPIRLEATSVQELPQRGVTLSHLRVLESAQAANYETVLIFEDDFKFSMNVKHLIHASEHMQSLAESSTGFDVIMLAANLDFGPIGGIEKDGKQTCYGSSSDRGIINNTNESSLEVNTLMRITTHNAQVAAAYIVHRRFYAELIKALQWAVSMLTSTDTANLYTVDQIWKQFQDTKHEWWLNCPRVGSGRGSKSDINY